MHQTEYCPQNIPQPPSNTTIPLNPVIHKDRPWTGRGAGHNIWRVVMIAEGAMSAGGCWPPVGRGEEKTVARRKVRNLLVPRLQPVSTVHLRHVHDV